MLADAPRRRMMMCFAVTLLCLCIELQADDAVETPLTGRRPTTDAELYFWMTNILDRHRFSIGEAAVALDMTIQEVREARSRMGLPGESLLELPADPSRLTVLPYPGGRHPRIGFLDGAVDPQRETKVSVFTPWQVEEGPADHVVVDVPEAIWSNLGLTYLAHTHVPTIWTKAGIDLEKLEWLRRDDGSLSLRRTLPNQIAFTSLVVPRADHVDMTLTLTNGTDMVLTDLRVQNCVMLKGARGFEAQTNDNKKFAAPYVAVHDELKTRWIITAWVPNHRPWGNDKCPCLHSDPKFPDCPPGETKTVRGRLWFYEGTDIDAELARVNALRWWE